MNKSTFEEQLAQNGKLIYTNKGDSMMPLIKQDRDLLIIEPAIGRLKKYDVPMYKRDSGQYVLHRILKVREDDYVICGDNRWVKEYGIQDRHIIGVLTAVVRDGKEISVNSWKYKLYVHLWCDMFPIRAFIVHAVNKIKRIIRR
ncbi:S24/S26 family peptidase [Ruminococcus flavefaciens]|uniref:S24/S26 family peptidase n=1 Tax=Ruminococcus flavefaciens TaxID=1265 RepID=UPI0026F10CBA|nr:S24/S26 family peptidase [Ruminococcus flavefaciens]